MIKTPPPKVEQYPLNADGTIDEVARFRIRNSAPPVPQAPVVAPPPPSAEDCADRAFILHRQYLQEHPPSSAQSLRARQVIQRNLANTTALALHHIVDTFSADDRRILRTQLRGLNPAPRMAYDMLNSSSGPIRSMTNTFECERFHDQDHASLSLTSRTNPQCPQPSGLERLRPGSLDIRNRTAVRLGLGAQQALDQEDRGHATALGELTEDRVRTRYQGIMTGAYATILPHYGRPPEHARRDMDQTARGGCADNDRTEYPTDLSARSIVDAVFLRGNFIEGNVSCKFDAMLRSSLDPNANYSISDGSLNELPGYIENLGTELSQRRARGEIPPDQFTDADGVLLTQINNMVSLWNMPRPDRSLRALREIRDLYLRFFRFLDAHPREMSSYLSNGLTRFRNIMTAWYVLDEGVNHDDQSNLRSYVRQERERLEQRHRQRRDEILLSTANINQSYFEVCSHQYEEPRQRGDIVVCGRVGLQEIVAGTYPGTRALFESLASHSPTETDYVAQGLRSVGCDASPGTPVAQPPTTGAAAGTPAL